MKDRKKVLELFEKYDAFTEDKINHGIESHRKGFAFLSVTDKNGQPISGAHVSVKQKTHAFKFGANLFMLDELETKEKNDLYKQTFAETFNMATLPFYWDAVEPEKDGTRYDKNSAKLYRRPPIDLCMEFCEKHGIEPREHALAYDRFFPQWLKNASVHEVKSAFVNRCREIAERYADKIPTIEVTNELRWAMRDASTKLYAEPDFIEWCFKTAAQYFPANQLVINEWSGLVWEEPPYTSAGYYAYIESAMLKGARIDGVGLQYHMFFPREEEYDRTRLFYDPRNLYAHLDLYARLGKPIQITEVTVPAYSQNTEDEELQAEILKKLYSVWFSHQNVEQIIYWNLVDGYAAFAEQGDMTAGENYYYGGLLRFDMTPKPAYYAIRDLIQNRWHTEESGLRTNQNGETNFKGFYGTYDVTVEYNGVRHTQTVDLSPNAENDFRIEL